MQIETLQFKDINPAEYNPRTIDDKAYEGLKYSLKKFGQVANLVVNKDGTLISGHQRMRAMMDMGWTEAKAYVVDLDKIEEKRLNVLMNSTAITGEFDELKLAEMIEELKTHDDYMGLMIDEIEPLDMSGWDGIGDDDTASTAGDLFIKKISINLKDRDLAVLLRKLDTIGEDPSEFYARRVSEIFAYELSGEN